MKKRQIKMTGGLLELLGDGQQLVAAGTHPSGVRYQWSPGLPETLPTLTLAQVNQIWEILEAKWSAVKPSSTNATQTAQASEGTSNQETLTQISDEEWPRLLDAIRALIPTLGSNDRWSEVGYALLSLQGTRPARQLFIDLSKKAPGFTDGAPEAWWEQHARQTPRTDFRHIFNLAKGEGWGRRSDPSVFGLVTGPVPGGSDSAQAGEDSAAAGEGAAGAGGKADGAGGSDGPDGGDTGTGADSVLAPAPTKPIIRLIEGMFSHIITQLEEIIAPEIYSQGPHLTRLHQGHDDREIRRSSDAVMLVRTTPAWLRTELGKKADWQRYAPVKQTWYNVDPTAEHPNTLFNLGSWRKIKPLEAIARAPFIRPDGSICDKPGYDNRTRVLYVPSAAYPAIPTAPDRDCARDALGRIRGVFDQFPWKEAASEAAFLSHILTEAARLAIDCSPMYFYDAPSSGTGKGLLQEMAARIVHGSDPALRAWVGDGDEIRKALYAAVLAGDRSLWFDNIPDGHKVRSPELCAFITSSTWTDRKLGESESLGVSNKMVLVGSGNNITPVSDLARRSLVVRMDANTERMKERVFKLPDLRAYVMANRAELLIDALTVIKAYHAAKGVTGMPVPMPSFVQWSHFCREPLVWLGLPDPVITQDHETDDESRSIRAAFKLLAAQFGERPFVAGDLARVPGGIGDQDGAITNAMISAGCAEPNSTMKIGYWLRSCRDKIGAGHKLVHAGDCALGIRWQFKRIHEDLA
jgi:hypothetical protein